MEFLEIPLFDDDIYKLLVRFVINLFFLTLIVAFAIYPSQRERDFAFTAVMMNVTVFFICFTLKKLELDIGMAHGLFAIFGVLRYRTDAIRAKEMTYLFIVIGIAVINSLSNRKTSYAEIALVNLLIFSAAMLKERMVRVGESTAAKQAAGKPKKSPSEKLPKYSLEYDRLEWLGPDHRDVLLADLRQRTGLDVVRVQVRNIDLPQNKATLAIWCTDPTVATNGGDPSANPTHPWPNSTLRMTLYGAPLLRCTHRTAPPGGIDLGNARLRRPATLCVTSTVAVRIPESISNSFYIT